jgi:hypothetical protein
VHSVDRNRRRWAQVQRLWQIHLKSGIGAAATDAGVSPGEIMKNFIILFFLPIMLLSPFLSSGAEKVSFFQDTVSEIDDRVVKFLSGSTWLMEREIIAIPLDDGIIITPGLAPKYDKENIAAYIKTLPKHGRLAYQGNEVGVTLIEGVFILQDGFLAKVIASHGKGAVLELDDGSLWSIPEYDQYDSGWWLPPYPVLVYANEMYLINLKKGKKIWVNRRLK